MSEQADPEFVGLYSEFFAELYSYCSRRLFGGSLAEDAVAEAFLKLAQRYPEFQGRSQRQIRNWLYGTASNVVTSFLRDARRNKAVCEEIARRRRQQEAETPAPGERLDWPLLHEALGTLKERHQQVIDLRFFAGMDSAEIAEALGIGRVAARVELSRALKALRKTLGDSFGGLV